MNTVVLFICSSKGYLIFNGKQKCLRNEFFPRGKPLDLWNQRPDDASRLSPPTYRTYYVRLLDSLSYLPSHEEEKKSNNGHCIFCICTLASYCHYCYLTSMTYVICVVHKRRCAELRTAGGEWQIRNSSKKD